jgi:beta-glucosidase
MRRVLYLGIIALFVALCNAQSVPDYKNAKLPFPFGYGMSCTTSRFDNLHVEPAAILPGGNAIVFVDVTNTGSRQGDDVAQMYIHQRVASVTRPVMKLRGFERITLKPGEKATVEFALTPESLALLNEDMHHVVEPGMFDIMVGPNSAETTSVSLRVQEPAGEAATK